MKDLSRLLKLKEENTQAGAEMRLEGMRFKRLKAEEKPRIVTAFNLFQTPEHIADKMAELLPELSKDQVILEPSAGLGRLYTATRRKGFDGKIIIVEQAPQCMAELYSLTDGDNVELIQNDFLESIAKSVDAVIMNPPFKQGLDIKHIKQAFKWLKVGGLLVALCYNGVKQNQQLKPLCNSWEVLPEKSFKESGTNASIALITVRKRG